MKDIGGDGRAKDALLFDLNNIFKKLQEAATEDYLQKRLINVDLALLERKIMDMYKKEKGSSEIDARKAYLAKGTVIQFRFTSLELESDSTGFVFREEYNTLSGCYEIKQHRW